MPKLLQQIVERTLVSQPDIIVAGLASPYEGLAAAAKRVRADLVIRRESQEGVDRTPGQVLKENPRLMVLTISADGHRATSYVTGPHQVVINDISPKTLVDAIRTAVAVRRTQRD